MFPQQNLGLLTKCRVFSVFFSKENFEGALCENCFRVKVAKNGFGNGLDGQLFLQPQEVSKKYTSYKMVFPHRSQ